MKTLEKTDILWVFDEEQREAIKQYGKKVEEQCAKGKNSFLSGDFEEAYEIFDKLYKEYPKETRFCLGQISSAIEANKEYSEIKKLMKNIDSHFSYYFEGLWADRNAETKHAIACYEKAMMENNTFVPAIFRLAYYTDLYGDEQGAIKLYEKCLPLKPFHSSILMNLGVLSEDNGDYDKAVTYYRRILEKYPENNLARLYLKDAASSLTMYVDEEKEKLKDQRNEILSTPITDFELSVRSRNCLNKMKIKTLGDLIKKSEAELLSYKNFGETSLAEIKEILNKKDLSLGMESDKFLEVKKKEVKIVKIAKQEKDESLLSKSISNLELSVRSRKCLSIVGVKSIGELLDRSEQELLNCKNFGQTSMQEIKRKLNDMGLSLKK